MTARPSPSRTFVSLGTKFLWGTVLVVTLVMAALMAIVEHRQRVAIVREIERRGLVLVRSLAAMSTDAFTVYNFTTLEQNATRLAEEEDVEYAIIVDDEQRVVAHSEHPGLVGTVLTDPVTTNACRAAGPLVQEATAAGKAPLYDFAIPLSVSGQRWGTARVGLSRRQMEAEIAQTRLDLILLAAMILVLGGLGSAFVARRIARPVRQLADGVAAVSRGELGHSVVPSTSDEIGRLALSFNEMASRLLAQRTALAASHTELNRQVVELSDLKSYTDNILASLASGVITLDLSGRVVTLNAAAESLLGFSLEAVRGKSYTEVLAATPEAAELLAGTLATLLPTPPVSINLTRPDGTSVAVEISSGPLQGAQRRDLGVVVVVRDLTAERRLEEQLRQAQKMEAVGRLAGGVAHDFNNLLTVIIGRGEFLSRGGGLDEAGRRELDVVREAADRAATLTRQLLAFSRQQILQPKVLDLNELIVSLTRMLRSLIGERIVLVTVLAPALGRIRADPGQIEQVLMNLAVNARDAMPQGGRLTIETRDVELDPELAHRRVGVRPGPYVALMVTDTGVGMSAIVRDHLFEPFFTTKPPGTGTGLGLATVYGIVRQSEGHISVESEPGQGAAFRIYLPRVDEAIEVHQEYPAPERPQGSETVLVVEDEDQVRSLTQETLQRQGYAVLAARHPGEALLLAERHPGPIHLLVTDVVLPQMDGRELADRLAAARPELKVIYVSGYASGASTQVGGAKPGRGFLGKPFSPAALARKVREVLDAVSSPVT